MSFYKPENKKVINPIGRKENICSGQEMDVDSSLNTRKNLAISSSTKPSRNLDYRV